jgi:predicted nucleic acid-binding protein
VLQRVVLADISREDLIVGTSHIGLRSNDAIHLASALWLAVTELLSYDRELAAASAATGLNVLSPGSDIL